MIKLIIYTFFFISLFSCKEKEIELIQSDANQYLFLIKNSTENDSLIKLKIIDFLIKNDTIKYSRFYKYNSDTKYFINNKEDYTGGFSSNEISQYDEDNLIAYFSKIKCKNDTTKLIKELYFYGNKGLKNNNIQIDTLIYHCN